MTEEKYLSEAAKWFLRDFEKIIDDFATEEGVRVVVVDKEGSLIIETAGVERICKLINSSEEGRMRYRDNYKMAFSLIKTQGKPIFIDCYAGFAFLAIPITIRGSIVGAIVSCGGRVDRGESREKLVEKFTKLADELDIMDKEDFLKAAIDEVKLVTEEEIKKRAEKLTKLIEILTETAQTPLKEVFG
jgi:ligand-binding sensor protein